MTALRDAATETMTVARARLVVEEVAWLSLKFNVMQQGKAKLWLYFPDCRDVQKLESAKNIKIVYGS